MKSDNDYDAPARMQGKKTKATKRVFVSIILLPDDHFLLTGRIKALATPQMKAAVFLPVLKPVGGFVRKIKISWSVATRGNDLKSGDISYDLAS